MKILAMLIIILSLMGARAYAKEPDCTGSERWPASMAFTQLKNAGITNNEKLDFAKTIVTKLASQLAKKNLYRQVHLVVFHEKTGSTIQVITINDASADECSGSPVDVYVISRHLGGT